MPTAEGSFPKVAGDIYYASEAGKTYFGLYGQNTGFGTGADGALSVPSGTTTISTPIKQYTSMNIGNGGTLTFGTYGKFYIFCQGNCTIAGNFTFGNKAATPPTTYDLADGATTGAGATAQLPIYEFWPGVIFKLLWEASSGAKAVDATAGGATAGAGGGASWGAAGNGGAPGAGGGASGSTGGAAGAGKCSVYLFVGGTLSIGSTAVISGAGANGGLGGTGNQGSGGGGGGGGGLFYGFVGGPITITAGASISLKGGNGGNGGKIGRASCRERV